MKLVSVRLCESYPWGAGAAPSRPPGGAVPVDRTKAGGVEGHAGGLSTAPPAKRIRVAALSGARIAANIRGSQLRVRREAGIKPGPAFVRFAVGKGVAVLCCEQIPAGEGVGEHLDPGAWTRTGLGTPGKSARLVEALGSAGSTERKGVLSPKRDSVTVVLRGGTWRVPGLTPGRSLSSGERLGAQEGLNG